MVQNGKTTVYVNFLHLIKVSEWVSDWATSWVSLCLIVFCIYVCMYVCIVFECGPQRESCFIIFLNIFIFSNPFSKSHHSSFSLFLSFLHIFFKCVAQLWTCWSVGIGILSIWTLSSCECTRTGEHGSSQFRDGCGQGSTRILYLSIQFASHRTYSYDAIGVNRQIDCNEWHRD